jgi:hypothetical protein
MTSRRLNRCYTPFSRNSVSEKTCKCRLEFHSSSVKTKNNNSQKSTHIYQQLQFMHLTPLIQHLQH